MDTAEPSLITHTPCDDPLLDEEDEVCCSVEQLRLLRAYTQRRGGHLSRLVRRKQAAVIPGSSAQSIVWDILSSRKPLSTSLSIGHVQALLLTAGLLLTALNCARVVLVSSEIVPVASCARVRFTVFSHRNGSWEPSTSSTSGHLAGGDFGLLMDGCETDSVAGGWKMETLGDTAGDSSRAAGPVLRQYHTAPSSPGGEPGLLKFNGLQYETGSTESGAAVDALGFVLECSGEESGIWQPVAVPARCGWFPAAGARYIESVLPGWPRAAAGVVPQVHVPEARGVRLKWDYSGDACKQATVLELIGKFVLSSGFVFTAGLAAIISQWDPVEMCSPVQFMAALGWVASILEIASSLLPFRPCVLDIYRHFGTMVFWATLFFSEYGVAERVLLLGLYQMTGLLTLRPTGVFGQEPRTAEYVRLVGSPLATLILGFAIACTRWLLLESQRRIVAPDRERVEAEMQRLVHNGNRPLAPLEDLVARLNSSVPARSNDAPCFYPWPFLWPEFGRQGEVLDRPRHRRRARVSSGVDTIAHELLSTAPQGMRPPGISPFIVGEACTGSEHRQRSSDSADSDEEALVVRCLDQLFFQAHALLPSFIRKVQEWGAASRAKFPLKRAPRDVNGKRGPTPLASWEQVANVPALYKRVEWATIQSAESATRKAMWKYDGDASLLVDLVRHVLVFESVSDQVACLKALERDSDVGILAVRNSQTVDSTAAEEYGKPCVTVNLFLDTPYTQHMGVSGHVCEIRLVLKSVWQLFDEEAQARFAAYRQRLHLVESDASMSLLRWMRRRWSRGAACRARRQDSAIECWPEKGSKVKVHSADGGGQELLVDKGVAVGDSETRWNLVQGGDWACGELDHTGIKSVLYSDLECGVLGKCQHSTPMVETSHCGDEPDTDTEGIKSHIFDFFGLRDRCIACSAHTSKTATHLKRKNDTDRDEEFGFPPILAQRLDNRQVLLSAVFDAASQDFRLNDVLMLLLTERLAHRAPLKSSQEMASAPCAAVALSMAAPRPAGEITLLPEAADAASCPGIADVDGGAGAWGTPFQMVRCGVGILNTLRSKCLRPGNELQTLSDESHIFSRSARWSTIFISANPITGSLCKWQFYVINCLCALGCMFILLHPPQLYTHDGGFLWQLRSNNIVKSSWFRFRTIQVRDAGRKGLSHIGALSILRNGCEQRVGNLTVVHNQEKYPAVAYLQSADGQAMEANGFEFRTSANGHPALDPVEFDFSYCTKDNALSHEDCHSTDWNVVGSNECIFSPYSLRCFVVQGRRLALSEERNASHAFDLRSPGFHSFCVIGRMFFIGVGLVSAVAFGAARRLHTARRVYGLCIFIVNGFVCGLPLAVGHFMTSPAGSGQWQAAFTPLAAFVMLGLGVGLSILWDERRFTQGKISLFFMCWTTMFICSVCEGQFIYGGGTFWGFTATHGSMWIETVLFFVVWCIVTMSIRRTYREAWLDIQADMHAYERLWATLRQNQGTELSLKLLAQLTGTHEGVVEIKPSLTQHTNKRVAFHVQLMRHVSIGLLGLPAKALMTGIERQEASSNAVLCLDQLYLQARILWPIFNGFVHRWAAASNGMFLTNDTNTLVKASEVSASRVKWAAIKGPTRAVEKLQRVYNNDVTRLNDVVRQTIVFASLDDLCACLKIISADSGSRNLRMKNRFAPSFNVATTGGYRDVALNVVIETQETLQLGVSGHICELQLMLQEFFMLKTEDGHKRYVEYRNKRAE